MNDQIELLKKGFAILLFIALFINCIGYFIIYQADLYSIKIENRIKIARGLVSSDQILIKVAGQQGKSIDKNLEEVGNDEVKWHGKIYDLIRKEVRESCIYYYCQQDETENNIIAANDNHVQNQTDHSTSKKIISIYKSIQLYYSPINSSYFEHNTQQNSYSSHNSGKLPVSYPDIIIPPPQFS